MIIASFPPRLGGAELQAERLAVGLARRGWAVRVITRLPSDRGSRALPEREVRNGVEIHRISSRLPGKLGSLQYLLGGLRRLWQFPRGSVYHAHDFGTPGLMALLAKSFFGGASVVKLRTGSHIYRRQWPRGFRRTVFNSLLSRHDRVAVVSTDLEAFMDECGVGRQRTLRLPNVVDTEEFSRTPSEEQRKVRSTLGLSSDKTLCLYVGRLERVKGVDVLIRAWSRLPEDLRAGAQMVLVGAGIQEDVLRKLSSQLGCQGSVVFAGVSERVREYYQAADLFVLPSRAEGMSNALLEAMSCELPVVATAVGGGVDLVMDGETGYLVPPEDPLALSRAVAKLMSRPEHWRTMGERARGTVQQVAGVDSVLDRWEMVYHELLA